MSEENEIEAFVADFCKGDNPTASTMRRVICEAITAWNTRTPASTGEPALRSQGGNAPYVDPDLDRAANRRYWAERASQAPSEASRKTCRLCATPDECLNAGCAWGGTEDIPARPGSRPGSEASSGVEPCPNCGGTKRALYFSELTWSHEDRECHVCRNVSPSASQASCSPPEHNTERQNALHEIVTNGVWNGNWWCVQREVYDLAYNADLVSLPREEQANG